MDYSIINSDYNSVTVKIHNFSDSDAAKFRKILMSKIPITAIDYVVISKNTSLNNDTTIAHRIGLIPIINNDLDDLPILELNAKGPEVKVSDLQVISGDCEILMGEAVLFYLNDDEEISLKAYCKIDTAESHCKYSPVSCVKFLNEDDGDKLFYIEGVGNFDTEKMFHEAIKIFSGVD